MLSIVGTLVLAALGTAQAPENPLGVLVDRVDATVNDSAIRHSQLVAATEGLIRAQEAKHGPLNPAERGLMMRNTLDKLIGEARMAMAAASLGPLTPDQVEQQVRAEIDHIRQEQERDLGGANAVSQELRRTHRTQAMLDHDRRITEQRRIAERVTIGRRLAGQSTLYVNPRMMRETYAIVRDKMFVHDGAAKIAQIRFTGRDAKANAEAAAAQWAKEPLEASELAKRFPDATPLREMEPDNLAEDLAAIRTLAEKGPVGAVSVPTASGNAYFVARVTAYVAPRHGKFEDPDVQRELRDLCAERVFGEFRADAMRRARNRTEVWVRDM